MEENFSQGLGVGQLFSEWLKCITFIVHFIFNLMLLLSDNRYWSVVQRSGNSVLGIHSHAIKV